MGRNNKLKTMGIKVHSIAFIIAALLMICLNSCSKKELVPEKTFYSILKEVHMSKGILGFSSISDQYSGRDSVSVYEDIYKKYGYSRETVENTYHYYFVYKTKKLEKFYNSFLGELSAEEARIVEERSLIMESDLPNDLNSTKLKTSPEGVEDKVYFERQLMSTGKYEISFDIKVDPSDPTYKPYLSLWTQSVEDGYRRSEPELITKVSYVKDGNFYHIIVPFEKRERPILIIFGNFLDTDGNPGLAGKNAIIKNLKLEYVP